MNKFVLWLLVGMFALALPSFAGGFDFLTLRWDDANDTTWSITATAADTSQPFLATPDMSWQHIWGSATYDSLVLTTWIQFNLGLSNRIDNPPAMNDKGWTTAVGTSTTDSIGYVATVDSTSCTPIMDCGTTTPVRWSREIIYGGSTTLKTSALTGQTHVLFYK
jgi:hypothetical protein